MRRERGMVSRGRRCLSRLISGGWKRLRPRMERRRIAGAAGREIAACGPCGRRGVAADLARRIAAMDGKAADCGGCEWRNRGVRAVRAQGCGGGFGAADCGHGWKGGRLRGLRVEKSRRARGGQNRACVHAYTKNI
jgi:hypothetical protein